MGPGRNKEKGSQMDKEKREEIAGTTFYVPISLRTGKVYMDENNGCYFIESKFEAENFQKSTDVRLEPPKVYAPRQFTSELYSEGVELIHVWRIKGKFDVRIKKEDCSGQFFNHETAGNINLLVQTSEKRFFQRIKRNSFIVPVLINPRRKKNPVTMKYSFAKNNDRKFFLIFVNMQEFEKWNNSQAFDYKPLFLSFEKIDELRKNRDLLVDPLSSRLVLTDGMIREFIKKGE